MDLIHPPSTNLRLQLTPLPCDIAAKQQINPTSLRTIHPIPVQTQLILLLSTKPNRPPILEPTLPTIAVSTPCRTPGTSSPRLDPKLALDQAWLETLFETGASTSFKHRPGSSMSQGPSLLWTLKSNLGPRIAYRSSVRMHLVCNRYSK
ncbi:hypothetical protein DSO57_1023650 [Entomophthora muscae]|uniref:Uncharacterized protein n=1 Tax=Entomophthora muscae TaxID=34485 RepID=A0ACC2RHL6_9FUNG|nr:hypothetical protein DSO57_1023650 [Entomophthora muscae]